MKHYILYNPLAGSGRGATDVNKVEALLEGEREAIDITGIKDYSEFFAGLSEDDVVVLCGGDGTINRFVNNVEGVEVKNKILYYAAGTGNDFINDIGRDEKAAVIDLDPYIKDLPTVEIDGVSHRFLNGVGFGIDGYCCEEGDKQRAAGKTNINYTAIAIKGLLYAYKPTDATVIVDGVEHRFKKVWIAPTMHGRCYGGGMIPTPDQDRFDPEGKASVMIFHGSGKLKTLMIFPSIFKGEHVKHTEAVTVLKGDEITVRFDGPRPLQIDGETVLGVTEYRVVSGKNAKVQNTAEQAATV